MSTDSKILDAKVPEGPIDERWTRHKDRINLVNPANKRLIDIIVVGIRKALSLSTIRYTIYDV